MEATRQCRVVATGLFMASPSFGVLREDHNANRPPHSSIPSRGPRSGTGMNFPVQVAWILPP